MKISIGSKQLLSALSLCQKAVGTNNIVPAVSNFRLQGKENELLISACNTEVSMETKITAIIDGFIDVLIPAEKITKLLSSLPDQGITIRITDDYEITITALSGIYELSGDSGADFIRINTDTETSITLQSDDLTEAIYSTSYARSNDQIQVRFTGLSVDIQKERIQFAGCNLMVLSVWNVKGKFKPAKMLLPISITNIIGSLSIPGDVIISYSKNSISFEYANLTVKSLLLCEEYPNYMGIVPTNDIKITVNRGQLLAAIKRILEFSNKVSKQIFISSDSGKLTIRGEDSGFKQKANETITIVEKEQINISVNGQFISDALSHISSEQIEIYWSAPDKAIIINEPNEKDNFVMVMALVNL